MTDQARRLGLRPRNSPRLSSTRSTRSSRAATRQGLYNEESNTDSDVSDTHLDDHSDSDLPLATKTNAPLPLVTVDIPRRSPQQSRINLRSSKSQSTSRKRRKIQGERCAVKYDVQASRFPSLPSENIPPWQNLEYQILVNIFQYAAYPLYKGASRDTGSVKWLLQTSELCKSFHEACMAALLYSPPLFPADRAQWLMQLLRASARDYDEYLPAQKEDKSQENAQPEESDVSSITTRSNVKRQKLTTDYRRLISRLDIEVKQLLVKKSGIDIEHLLAHTPLLKDLHLYHNHDRLSQIYMWASSSYSKDKWSYANLFDLIDKYNIQLSTFEWNGRFLKQDKELTTIPSTMRQPCLKRIKHLHFLNLNVRDVEKDLEQLTACQRSVVDAIEAAEELEDVHFQTCNILDEAILRRLPANLKHLTIQDCLFVQSEDISAVLTALGTSLRSLHLLHNQSMDLAFMRDLARTAPNLQDLKIDLNYYDPSSYRDVGPLFDDLLPLGSPSWPRTLHSIFIDPLRKISTQDAEDFFITLCDSAPQLSYLRTLKLKAILSEVDWRDRARIRTEWHEKMRRTFDARCNASIKDPVGYKPSQLASLTSLTKQRSAKNLRASTTNSTSTNSQVGGGPVIRDGTGKCTTFFLEISDQRPAQEQYKETDFLDSEPEDDGEWNGRDVVQETYRLKRGVW